MVALPAGAQDAEKRSCSDAYVDGQSLSNEGKLLAARDAYASCLDPSCPAQFRTDCARWLEELNERVPTIGLVVRGADGNDAPDAVVYIDGERIDDWVGKQLEVDPGQHTIKVELGPRSAEVPLIAVAGDRARKVEVTLVAPTLPPAPAPAPAPAPPPPPPPKQSADKGHPVAAYVLGVVGVGALAAFAGLAIVGKMEADTYNDVSADFDGDGVAGGWDGVSTPDEARGCAETRDASGNTAPNCPSDLVDSTRLKFIIADVSLGVGIVAIGVAAGLFLDHHLNDPEPGEAAVRVQIQGLPGGGVGGVTVDF